MAKSTIRSMVMEALETQAAVAPKDHDEFIRMTESIAYFTETYGDRCAQFLVECIQLTRPGAFGQDEDDGEPWITHQT